MRARPHISVVTLRSFAAALCGSLVAACAPTSTATTTTTHPTTPSPAPTHMPTAAARDDVAQSGLPTAAVSISTTNGPVRFRVELASTPRERNVGLMFREHLDDDAGMLFLFEREQLLTFWMKNTYIPLDMLFIDARHQIVGIVEDAAPQTTTSRGVPGDSQYVLELNAGTARRLGLSPRQTVTFEGVEAALQAAGKDAP